MKYLLFICFLFSSFVSFAQCDEISELKEKIEKTKEITLEDMIEIDNQIMELQFNKMNELFEQLRNDLSKVKIVDTVGAEIIEEEIIIVNPVEKILFERLDEIVIESDSDDEAIKGITKAFKEDEMILLGKRYNYDWTSKGTKKEKAILLLESYNQENG